MDEAERNSVGAALRKPNKGPAGAVIREASQEESDRAFADVGGERGPVSMPGDHKAGGPGGKGSVAGLRVGSKEAGGGLDARAAENLRIRNERRAAAALAARGGKPVAPPQAPVQTPSQAPLEEWETPGLVYKGTETPLPESRWTAAAPATANAPRKDYYADFPQGDRLAVAQADALAVLDAMPDGFELAIVGDGLDAHGVALVMGLGFLIGKGWAAYRGDNHYRITADGRAAARQGKSGHA